MTFKPGDLVMVIKPAPCCGAPQSLGHVGTVVAVYPPMPGYCPVCGKDGELASVDADDKGRLRSWANVCLMLIPPLSEPEAINTDVPCEVLT